MIPATSIRRPATIAIGATLLLMSATASLAEDAPITTADPRTPAPSSASSGVENLPKGRAQPPPIDEDAMDAQAASRVHGAVQAEVGTNGHRRVSGIVTAPLGKTGEITVAVDRMEGQTRFR